MDQKNVLTAYFQRQLTHTCALELEASQRTENGQANQKSFV